METCLNYHDSKTAFFSSDERKWINKINKLAEEYPDEVQILSRPEDNDGCLYAKIPAAWMKIQAKRKFTDEEKQLMRERMEVARKNISKR